MLAFALAGGYTWNHSRQNLEREPRHQPRVIMHLEAPQPPLPIAGGKPWYRELTRYHWFVLVIAALGWLFDTMDQQLFNLARKPAVTALLKTTPSDPRVDEIGPYTTSIFITGWA